MTISDTELESDAEAPPAAGSNSLAELSGLVQEWQELSRDLADMSAKVMLRAAEILDYEMTKIPDMMAAIGVKKVTAENGAVVEVKPIVSGSIPKKNMPEAARWLREHESGDIIKQTLTLTFTTGQDEDARKITEYLVGEGYAPVTAEAVHASTLKSWATEKLAAGVELPLKLLGIFHGRKAIIKLPK